MKTSFVVLLAACGVGQTDPAPTSQTDQAVTSTTQTTSIPLQLATPSPINLGGFTVGGAASGSPIELDITAQAGWTSTVNTDLSWDTSKVRQGATVTVNRDISSVTGELAVVWSVSGSVTLPEPVGKQGFGPIPFEVAKASCVPDFTPQNVDPIVFGGLGTPPPQTPDHICDASGGGADWCLGITGDDGSTLGLGGTASIATTDGGDEFTAVTQVQQPNIQAPSLGNFGSFNSGGVGSVPVFGGQYVGPNAAVAPVLPHLTCVAVGKATLFETFGVPGPYVALSMAAKFQIVSQLGHTSSEFDIDDAQVQHEDVAIIPEPGSDALVLPCDKPVGADVQYTIGSLDWKPATFLVSQQAFLTIGADDGFGNESDTLSFSAPISNPINAAMNVELTGDGDTLDLGALQANNVLPTVTAGPFSGVEGQATTLSATASSACPITSYAWNLSNGGTAFGATPAVTFGAHGPYSGQVVVTDATHNSQTADFSVAIANAPPISVAGPSTAGAWGTAIALVGQGSDPGNDPLTYVWDFGDGTRGVGGATAQHAYASPGTYTATFTVCDDLGACTSSTTPVTVRARRTSVAFTGASTGVYSAQASLAGAIVDELGQPVVGGTLAFTLGGNPAGAAQTDSSGTATSQQTIDLPAGTYATTATFGGTGYYTGGSTAGSFAVARMGSAIQYTGATTGTANKVVALSAKLADALGRPLAGKPVVFQLGAQHVQAVSDGNGIAAASLALAQKNGSYVLTATWTPAGTDATELTGTSTSGTFTIGNKK